MGNQRYLVLCVGILLVATSIEANKQYQKVYEKIFNRNSEILDPLETHKLLESLQKLRTKQINNYDIEDLIGVANVLPGECTRWEFYKWNRLFGNYKYHPTVNAYLDHFLGDKFRSCGEMFYRRLEDAVRSVQPDNDLKILTQVFNSSLLVESDPAGITIKFLKLREPTICKQLWSGQKSLESVVYVMRFILGRILPRKVQDALGVFLVHPVAASIFVKDKEISRLFERVMKIQNWFMKPRNYNAALKTAMVEYC